VYLYYVPIPKKNTLLLRESTSASARTATQGYVL
jgi:hypothetical protein